MKDLAVTPPPELAGADSDEDLFSKIARGDRQALSALYDRHAPRVFGLALRVLCKHAEAESVVSDVFFEVWRKPDRFNPSLASCQTYLLMLTRSRAIDRLRAGATRAEKTRAAAEEKQTHIPEKESALSPQAIAMRSERRESVVRAVSQLDEDQREPLRLAFFEGLTHVEIAERLDKPLGTVKTRIRTGLRKLRDALVAEEADDAQP